VATYYVDGAVGNDVNAGTSPGGGNAWATLGKAASTMAIGDLCYVKASATYSIGAAVTFATGAGSVLYGSATRLIGYTTTPGDNGRALIQASAGSFGMIHATGSGWTFENFIIDGNSQTSITGALLTGSYHNVLRNCKVLNCTNSGVKLAGTINSIIGCEVTACSGASGAVYLGCAISAVVLGCYIHDNTTHGIFGDQTGSDVAFCIVESNSGGSSDGILISTWPVSINNCVFYGNGRHGLHVSGYWIVNKIFNNIFVSNSGYGLNAAVMSPAVTDPRVDYNAFYGNSSGARNIILAGAHDVTLSGDPFTNAGAGDFTLNGTSGAGAACRGVGFPGVM